MKSYVFLQWMEGQLGFSLLVPLHEDLIIS